MIKMMSALITSIGKCLPFCKIRKQREKNRKNSKEKEKNKGN